MKGFNTASGKYCCNLYPLYQTSLLIQRFNTASGKYCCNNLPVQFGTPTRARFNTASGKYCCNKYREKFNKDLFVVSIPQAVSTVATKLFLF